MTTFFIPHDFGSRNSGAAAGCQELFEDIGRVDNVMMPRNAGAELQYLIHSFLKEPKAFEKRNIFVLGDHLVSFYIAISYLRKFGNLNFVYFDAHHDCYNDDILCHWSFVHHLFKYRGMNITNYGASYQMDKCERTLANFDPSLPTYISIDADYFPEISSVGHYVSNRTQPAGVKQFQDSFNKLSATSEVVGIDFCEWYGGCDMDLKLIKKDIFTSILE